MIKHSVVNTFTSSLPGDPVTENYVRTVINSCFSFVNPTKVPSPQIISVNDELSKELDLLRQRIRSGCKADLLDLVSLKGVGRARARTLASMGVRQPSQLLSMSKNQVSKLKSLRGWGPKIVENLIDQVKSYKVNHLTEKPRSDDEPLPGEEHLS